MKQDNQHDEISDVDHRHETQRGSYHGKYTADDLVQLSDREHVRARPGMYIGDTTQRGRHALVNEVIDLMLDCFRSGRVSQISVVIHQDESLTVRDDNTSCSLAIDTQYSENLGREATNFEREISSLQNTRGAAFFGSAYQSRGWLHGVSIVCVNFLSTWFHVEACSESEVYRLKYRQGVAEGPVETTPRSSEVGTEVSFLPDPDMFSKEGLSFDHQFIKGRLEVLAYLNAGLKAKLTDERTGEEMVFVFPEGVREWINRIPQLHRESFCGAKPIFVHETDAEIDFQIAIQSARKVASYVNDTQCDGGTHLSCFFEVLKDVLNEVGQREHWLASNSLPSAADYESDLMGMIALRIKEPLWQGATRTLIGNPELSEFVEAKIRPKLVEYFKAQPELARHLIYNARSAAQACVSR